MLARSFLPAENLGISEQEHGALVQVLGALERGELVHAEEGTRQKIQNGFNMSVIDVGGSCGTTACICGWAQIFSPGVFDDFQTAAAKIPWSHRPAALINLLLFDQPPSNIAEISVQQAAQALSNYLTTGAPKWGAILGSGISSRIGG
jgi:hypothetical protein